MAEDRSPSRRVWLHLRSSGDTESTIWTATIVPTTFSNFVDRVGIIKVRTPIYVEFSMIRPTHQDPTIMRTVGEQNQDHCDSCLTVTRTLSLKTDSASNRFTFIFGFTVGGGA